MSNDKSLFEMTAPEEQTTPPKYAFWLLTHEQYLIDFVKSLRCVHCIHIDEGRCLVAVKDEFDADEAWHYIRTELENEQLVPLDDIWDDAMWL